MPEIRYPIQLFDKQWQFALSGARETLFSGGVGCGKTRALVRRELQMAVRYPGSTGVIGCFTAPMLRDIIKPILFEDLSVWPDDLWTYNQNDEIIKLKTGRIPSKIWLRHLEDENKRKGPSVDRVSISELGTGITEPIYKQMMARLRLGVRQHMSADTNPGSTESWIYKRFYEDTTGKRRVINAETDDNPHLPQDYIDDMYDNDEAWVRRYVKGEWGIMEGHIYSEFKRDLHVKPFTPDPDWRWFLAVDFGFRNPFVALWIGLDKEGHTYIWDEHYASKITVDVHAAMISGGSTCAACNRVHNWREHALPVRNVVFDTADPGAFFLLQKKLKEYNVYVGSSPARKDVSLGIQFCQTKLHQSRVTIHPKCVNFLREINLYEWAPAIPGRPEKEMPRGVDDHAMDAWRYFEATVGNI